MMSIREISEAVQGVDIKQESVHRNTPVWVRVGFPRVKCEWEKSLSGSPLFFLLLKENISNSGWYRVNIKV